MKKPWADRITDEQIKYFFEKELGCEKITNIKRRKRDDEIICDITTLWDGEPTDKYKGKKGVLALRDKFFITPWNISTMFYNVSDLKNKWQMYQIAIGAHPWMVDNPYIKEVLTYSPRLKAGDSGVVGEAP